jgi:glycosyltransferase involved in cell wall biosynthesis
MKLVASMPARNELTRYLPEVVESLERFVDEIVVLDDGSVDGTYEWCQERESVTVKRAAESSWSQHEGAFRRELQDVTLEQNPSHVLAIDADELIPDGPALRQIVARSTKRGQVFTLRMVELWALDPLTARYDGGWKPRVMPLIYRVPKSWRADWYIFGPPMACPRLPPAARILARRRSTAVATGLDVLHLGWADPTDRVRRAERYADLDGGRYHAKRHLDSILWPDEKCDLRPYA